MPYLPYKPNTTALIIVLSALSSPGMSDSLLSWQQLSAACQSSQAQQQALCQGYIMGAADAGDLCLPPNIKPATIQDLVMTTLNDVTNAPAQAIQQRLQTMFPCNSSNHGDAATHADEATSDQPADGRSENWSNKKRIGK